MHKPYRLLRRPQISGDLKLRENTSFDAEEYTTEVLHNLPNRLSINPNHLPEKSKAQRKVPLPDINLGRESVLSSTNIKNSPLTNLPCLSLQQATSVTEVTSSAIFDRRCEENKDEYTAQLNQKNKQRDRYLQQINYLDVNIKALSDEKAKLDYAGKIEFEKYSLYQDIRNEKEMWEQSESRKPDAERILFPRMDEFVNLSAFSLLIQDISGELKSQHILSMMADLMKQRELICTDEVRLCDEIKLLNDTKMKKIEMQREASYRDIIKRQEEDKKRAQKELIHKIYKDNIKDRRLHLVKTSRETLEFAAKALPYGSGNIFSDLYQTNFKSRGLVGLAQATYLHNKQSKEALPDDVAIIANSAIIAGAGNCIENAAVTFCYLVEKSNNGETSSNRKSRVRASGPENESDWLFKEKITLVGFSDTHRYTIIGDYEKKPKKAFVIDSWFPVAQVELRFSELNAFNTNLKIVCQKPEYSTQAISNGRILSTALNVLEHKPVRPGIGRAFSIKRKIASSKARAYNMWSFLEQDFSSKEGYVHRDMYKNLQDVMDANRKYRMACEAYMCHTPNQISVKKNDVSYSDLIFSLDVRNVCQRNKHPFGDILPEKGQVKKIVEMSGNLKSGVKSGNWDSVGNEVVKHQISRSDITGGRDGSRWFLAGKSIEKQLFLYKNKNNEESIIKDSGFEIEYKHSIFDNGVIIDNGKIFAKEGMYSILEIRKKPSNVDINGYKAHSGLAEEVPAAIWKIEQPKKGTAKWQVTNITNSCSNLRL